MDDTDGADERRARELHRAAGSVFRQALRRAPAGRRAHLAAAAAELGPDVAREAESLLRNHLDDSFLERPAGDEPAGPPARLPERVGSYRVESVLGWGGSGVVYLAEQAVPRRRVAVKVLRWDLASPEALERFEQEAEVLGRLDHPGIARVLEAGWADGPTGRQPFIAMEFIDGRPLADAARGADLDERVRLAADLAGAVAHAHEKGIVHRDLKPANVLVRADGRPVVLDFGIARRLVGSDSAAEELSRGGFETVTGQLLGTLAYMSPEQAAGGRRAVDERADVYALGVVTYELISDQLPYDTREKIITEALRIVEEADPTPLSHYGRTFAGDLENVVAMALRKEPERRYADAGELADDLRAVLEDRPVRARPASRAYRARKFLARHRRAAAAALSLVAMLVLVLVVTVAGLRAARAAERRLAAEHARTQRLADRLLLERLESELDGLWPMTPAMLPRYDAWLADATDLAGRAERHVRALDDTPAAVLGPDEVPELERLVRGLGRLRGPGGALEEVRRRRAFADELPARTLDDHAGTWSDATRAIAADPAYRGLVLRPQLGLVPLGPDPDSGLWEFAHFGPTGELARRDHETQRLAIDGATGLVLVLLPGGEFLFGAQKADPDGVQYDPRARDHEGPPEPVRLAPFFLSKYEMTQAQWERVTGENPSYWAEGDRLDDYRFGPTTPVESVTWEQCVEVLGRLDLTLPTETQWEYAARGGTRSIWWCGDDPDCIRTAANLSGSDDGYRLHAPVGTFPANPFGLHEILGNLSEWCLDVFKVECRDWPVRAGDGLRLTDDGPERVLRGGSSTSAPAVATVSRRDDALRYEGNRLQTVRPVLAVR